MGYISKIIENKIKASLGHVNSHYNTPVILGQRFS